MTNEELRIYFKEKGYHWAYDYVIGIQNMYKRLTKELEEEHGKT